MLFEKGKIELIDVYKGYGISIEHDLNIFNHIDWDDLIIYTIEGMGRTFQGTPNEAKRFIDEMLEEYGGYE